MQTQLFQENITYVIDTSGLIYLESTFNPDLTIFKAVWEEIEDLIVNGNFKTIDFVEKEINSYQGKKDFLKTWIKKWKNYFVVETDADCFNAAIPIINEEYKSGFFDAKKTSRRKRRSRPIFDCLLQGL